jgi:hypothetical protein
MTDEPVPGILIECLWPGWEKAIASLAKKANPEEIEAFLHLLGTNLSYAAGYQVVLALLGGAERMMEHPREERAIIARELRAWAEFAGDSMLRSFAGSILESQALALVEAVTGAETGLETERMGWDLTNRWFLERQMVPEVADKVERMRTAFAELRDSKRRGRDPRRN